MASLLRPQVHCNHGVTDDRYSEEAYCVPQSLSPALAVEGGLLSGAISRLAAFLTAIATFGALDRLTRPAPGARHFEQTGLTRQLALFLALDARCLAAPLMRFGCAIRRADSSGEMTEKPAFTDSATVKPCMASEAKRLTRAEIEALSILQQPDLKILRKELATALLNRNTPIETTGLK